VPFQLSPAEEQVRKIVREYVEREIIPLRKTLENGGPAAWWENCAIQLEKQTALGFHLLLVPKAEGGTGLGFVARSIVIEEITAGFPGMYDPFYRCDFGYYFAKATGGPVGKRLMEGVLKGKLRASPAITESTGGSDMMAMQSKAKKVPGGWVLNGRKVFISGGDVDFVMALVKTGDPSDPKTKGTRALSAFIVEKGMEGFRTSRKEDTVAKKEELREWVFDNCFVDDDHLVGGEGGVGRGMAPVFMTVGDVGRMTITSHLNGLTLGAYRCASQYARERKLFGKPIGSLQAIQFRLAEMAVDLEATRLLTYRAAWLRNQGVRADTEQAVAKYFATQAAQRATMHAVNIHGCYGVLTDYMPQRYFRDAPVRAFAGGTDEAMKNMIGAAVLKDANPDLSSKNMLDAGW
jgi:butyryl-CoA dehydrogenase